MHCNCCDHLLDNEEATARFVNEDKDAPLRYVEMCRRCRSFLPPEIKIVTKSWLLDEEPDDAELIESEDEDGEE